MFAKLKKMERRAQQQCVVFGDPDDSESNARDRRGWTSLSNATVGIIKWCVKKQNQMKKRIGV